MAEITDFGGKLNICGHVNTVWVMGVHQSHGMRIIRIAEGITPKRADQRGC